MKPGLSERVRAMLAPATTAPTRVSEVGSVPSGAKPTAAVIAQVLRELRQAFGSGGLPPIGTRDPDEGARLAAFRVLQALAHILDQFRRRIDGGEGCRLVVRDRGRALGQVTIEIAIVPLDGATP
jgi:hypothetical protein